MRNVLGEPCGRFDYEGRIGAFDLFVVFAAYFDESGNYQSAPDRVAVAGALASADKWAKFEYWWAKALETVRGAHPKFSGFHAKRGSYAQRLLNDHLGRLGSACNIVSLCVIVDRREYEAATTPIQRSVLGNVYGFATIACIMLVSQLLADGLDNGDGAGFYVDSGGPGYAKAVQFLTTAYSHDKSRQQLRISAFGPADRRVHLPVHVADLVAHEIITNSENSVPLRLLGERVAVIHVAAQELQALVSEYQSIANSRGRFVR